METTITARHCSITDALRERAGLIMDRLRHVASRPMETAVVFDTDGNDQTVELRLHSARGELFIARADAPDHRTALDRAEEKLRRQLDRAFARPRRPDSTIVLGP